MSNPVRIEGIGGKTGRRRRSLDDMLFGRVATCLAAGFWILAVLGCMNLNFGSTPMVELKPDVQLSDVRSQEGKILVQPGKEQVVYYIKPYSTPPNLELDDTTGVCDIVEQKENYFKVRFNPTTGMPAVAAISWKARGAQTAQSSDSVQVPGGAGTNVQPASMVVPSNQR
jgi:hypothetical protein